MLAHIDADAFFVAVLVRKFPQFRGKPLLALGAGGGCVISASYEAKAKGVRTGMKLKEKGPHEGKTVGLSLMLQDRPAAAIPGIGHRRHIHTDIEGWRTAWDIAQAPEERLLQLFGKQGRELKLELLGQRLFDVSTAI